MEQQQLSKNKQSAKGNRTSSSSKNQNSVASTKTKKKNEIYGYEEPVPTCCDCGTQLRFELQILPSILHVLNVDDFAVAEDNTTATATGSGGGMDWGNICIYTCPNQISACRSNDAFCIIQDSIDQIHLPNNNNTNKNMPQQSLPPAASAAAIVIPEDAQFDQEDDDDGIVLLGDEYENEYDDDDDESVW